MPYVPVSTNVYCSAFAGMMGALAAARQTTDNVAADYDHDTKVAGAFAAAFDTAFNDSTPNVLQLGEIESIIGELFYTVFPTGAGSESKTATNYIALANAVIARMTQADAFVASEGIVPPLVPGNPSIAIAQVKYVSKGGNDATGDGSLGSPYLTIQAAITSITDAAAAKPYAVYVFPGVYATAFKLKAYVFVIGTGTGVGNYNNTPLNGTTVIAPDATNVLDGTFAGATIQATGIMNCALSTTFLADFALIASTANSVISLQNITTRLAVTIKGSGNKEYLYVNNFWQNRSVGGAASFTVQDMGGSVISALMNDFAGGIQFLQAAALQSFHTIAGGFVRNVLVNWTSALIANTLTLSMCNCSEVELNITGNGVNIEGGNCSVAADMTDAAQRLGFAANAANTVNGVTDGMNFVSMAPTVARVLTIDTPVVGTTMVLIRNRSLVAPIDLTFLGGTVDPGAPTYVQAEGELMLWYSKITNRWMSSTQIQSGVATLTNGVSVLIPCDITARSRCVATLSNFAGATGVPVCFGADKNVGTRAGGGGFKITSMVQATGATLATDQGSYDWHVYNSSFAS